jgi:hypothetical protein
MLYDIVKKGWEARLTLLGLSARKFCSVPREPELEISYSTWKQSKNPPISWCDLVEREISKLEA